MKRPNVPALDELEGILQDIEEMEEAINKLKQRIREIPLEIRDQVQ